MSDDGSLGPERPSPWTPSAFLTAPVCAVAAFTLSVAALLGQNAVTVGVSSVFQGFSDRGESFYWGFGLATAGQAALALFLAQRTLASPVLWEATLGRAAVVVSALALVAAALIVIGGGVLYDPPQ